jgi:hypothetical protein
VGRGEPKWTDYLTLRLSERVRGEFVDWFEPPAGSAPAGAERYDFFASQFRAGFSLLLPHVQLILEMQDTELANVPEDASLAAPQGISARARSISPIHARVRRVSHS